MARIDSLLAAMTLEEKIGQLTMVAALPSPEGFTLADQARADIAAGRAGSVLNVWGAHRTRALRDLARQSRLGIPLLVTYDVLHGQRTIFPIPLAETAAFDPSLWEATARVAAREAAEDGVDLTYAPMLDVARDPRWGRIAESPGEDPWLCSQVAAAKVRGYQGASGVFGADRVAATAKHLAAYGASVAGRDYAAIDISERTLHEVYLPPFAAAVAARVAVIMPAFVSLAGVPMTAHKRLLRDIVRGQWGFDGVMISDFQAVAELIAQGVAVDLVEAAALALEAGVDIDMVGEAYAKGLPQALERGLVRMTGIDDAVRRVLALKERLGLFDDARGGMRASSYAVAPARASSAAAMPAQRIDASSAPEAAPTARDLARDAARRSIVLLKNAIDALPLSATVKRLAVIGPLADAPADMLGPWAGAGVAQDAVSILAGLRAALPDVDIRHAKGVDVVRANVGVIGTRANVVAPGEGDIDAAVTAARDAEAIVLCVGESADMSGEAASRARPDLPAAQQALAHAMLQLGKPVIVVLSSGRPLMVTELIERADAVVATWFLGCEAGHAIADVLTGRCNPSGRLPVTWPRDVGQVPIYFAQGATGRPADPDNRYTSKYIDLPVAPLFPFGHGLSYTRFSHRNLRLRATELSVGDELIAAIDVRNDGARDGEETLFLFVHDIVASVGRPLRELKAYVKVRLAPGETKSVALSVPVADFTVLDVNMRPVLEPGEFDVYVGPDASAQSLFRARFRIRAMP